MKYSTLSTRYAPVVLVLLALAAVPTVMHSYMDSTEDDGRSAQALPMALAGRPGAPTTRRATWGQDRFGSNDWIERNYAGAPAARLFVGRTFDPKRLYHHPELAIDYGRSYEPATIIRLASRPDVPVHLLRGSDAGGRAVALYSLQYRGDYIDDPIRFQLQTSFELLFRRRSPLTLFFAVQDLGAAEDVEQSAAAALLVAAMNAFDQQPSASQGHPR